ncbi:MAG: Rieske 2Fe-2S domain-containing protein [Gemmatales bacterium]|nr:Rieske 2Fe-2S domain-containing protein [Gemmatales bacterium]MDW7994342.1 Rieske 2Fe-2S domain-containing protein [Gemmatales bacterium]
MSEGDVLGSSPGVANSASSPTSASLPHRRSFLRWLLRGLETVLAAVLGVPTVVYFLSSGRPSTRPQGFRRVAKLSDILLQGKLSAKTGKRVYEAVIRDVRRDGWTLFPNEIIGRVWLVLDVHRPLDPNQPDETLVAFTSVCPHLGCAVGYDAENERFSCPCHAGTFDISGRVLEGPPSRPMDRLEIRLVADPSSSAEKQDYFVEVRYLDFVPDVPEKIPKA